MVRDGRSAATQALGHSRGGLTTEVIVTAADDDSDRRGRGAGQAYDAPHPERILDRTLRRALVLDEIVGDKGFDRDQLRSAYSYRDVFADIPLKAKRDPDASAWDPAGCRARTQVKRLFAKAKQFRRVATRYDKLAASRGPRLHPPPAQDQLCLDPVTCHR